MSIALIFSNRDPQNWKEEIKKHLPETRVEIYPDIENFEEVEFIVGWKPRPRYFDEFPNLKVIQSSGAGVDHLFPEHLSNDLRVCRIVDPHLKTDMFEHVLACLMTSLKNFRIYQGDKINEEWNTMRYRTIKETAVTILGLGELGSYVATNLVQLGFNVAGWSNSPKDIADVITFTGRDQLYEAVANTDFIVNILPLTEQTVGVLDLKLFKACSALTAIINVGRGGHLNDRDLLTALEDKLVKEAYLDVFHQEPLPKNHPFWSCQEIFITPHVASMTNVVSSVKQVVENYNRMKDGNTLLNEVSLLKGY